MGSDSQSILIIAFAVGLVIFAMVLRYILKYILHRGVDTAVNKYKDSKNKQQAEKAKQYTEQPEQFAKELKDYYTVAASYGIVVHSLAEDHGMAVQTAAPQTGVLQTGASQASGSQTAGSQAAASKNAIPLQNVQPVQQKQPSWPIQSKQPQKTGQQPKLDESVQPAKPKQIKNSLPWILVGVVLAFAVAGCGIFGVRIIRNRFLKSHIDEYAYEAEQQAKAQGYTQNGEVVLNGHADVQNAADDGGSPTSENSGTTENNSASENSGAAANNRIAADGVYVKLSEVPDMQWLLHLLKQVRFGYGQSLFTSDYLQQNTNVIASLVGHPKAVCYMDYDIAQPIEYTAGAQDPRGYINDRYAGCYFDMIPESSVVWVAENICHFDAPAIDSWTREEDYFYLQDGYYYAFWGGIGDDFRYPEIVGVKREGDRYLIYYNYVFDETMYNDGSENYQPRGLIMEAAYENIDGHKYWTIYQETELGHAAAAEEVYQDKAAEYADISGKYDWQSIVHASHETTENTSTASDQNNINDGFYGLWVGAWSNRASADDQARAVKEAGYDGQVFITSDWENLNPTTYYVVTAGTYSSESEARANLADVQNRIIDEAYVKYSGKHK